MKKVLFILSAFVLLIMMTSICFAQDAQTEFLKGLKKFKSKEYKNAIPHFDAAIKTNKGFVKAYVFRGLSNFLLEEHQKAISDLNFALENDPENVTALFARGQAFLFIGESKKAIADFTSLLRIQPENSWSYMQRGICYFRLDDLKKSMSDLSKSISFNPKRSEAFFIRGMCYWKQKEYEASIRDFKRALDLEPDRAYYQLFYYVAKAMNGDKSLDELKAFQDKNTAKADEFPYYLIDMMLGRKTPAECLKLAEQYQPEKIRGIVVQQTQFVMSSYFTINGDEEKAKKYLHLAANGEEKMFMISGVVKTQFYEFLGPKKEVCGEAIE